MAYAIALMGEPVDMSREIIFAILVIAFIGIAAAFAFIGCTIYRAVKHDWQYTEWNDAARPNEQCWKRQCRRCSRVQYLDVDGWCKDATSEREFVLGSLRAREYAGLQVVILDAENFPAPLVRLARGPEEGFLLDENGLTDEMYNQ